MTFGEFSVRDSKAEAQLKEIGGIIKAAMDTVPGYGFALLIFEYGPGGNMFYASSAQRDSVIEAMQEFIEKHKGS